MKYLSPTYSAGWNTEMWEPTLSNEEIDELIDKQLGAKGKTSNELDPQPIASYSEIDLSAVMWTGGNGL